MKLDVIQQPAIMNEPATIDLDVASRLGPVISQHISALSTLCKLLPDNVAIQSILEELKSCVANSVDIKNNVLETDKVSESVVYRLDKDNPMDDSEILILGGAGRYTMKALRNKAAREATMLAEDLTGNHVNYRGAAHSVKQVANTINTMVAALDELEKNSSYISEDLPLIQEPISNNELDKQLELNFVFEMYDTMYPGLGDKAWVAISKRLRSQGLSSKLIESLINRAIIKRSI